MKAIPLLLALALGPAASIHAQMTGGRRAGNGSDGPAASAARLELTTRVIGAVSCSPDRLRLSLRLTFKNVGNKAVILDKRSGFIGRHMVSRNPTDADAKKYERETRATVLNADAAGFYLSPPADMSNFVVLRPGEVYELEEPRTGVSLWIDDGTPDAEGDLRVGEHFLQVQVDTWNYPSQYVSGLRELWGGQGFLWSETLTSLPMLFIVEKDRPITKCTTPPTPN